MIKVLKKSFTVMEFVAAHDGPVLPTEAAVALNLNRTTTVRILRDLLELGYVSQISRNKGYMLGPMTQSVFARNIYREKLIRAAAPVVSQCAEQIRESVILAILQGTRRYVLLHENRNPAMRIDINALYYEDVYITATGRVSLAHLPPPQLDAIVRKIGLPDKHSWPESASYAAMKRELARIRQSGFLSFLSPLTDLHIFACPIFSNDDCIAALGASFPKTAYSKAKHTRTLKAIKESAAAITDKLMVIRTAG